MPTTTPLSDPGSLHPKITVVRRLSGDGGLSIYMGGNFRLALSTSEAAKLAQFIRSEVLDAVPGIAYRSESPR